ncbi:MAG: peptidoglycan DD-metalloendopeptidase family protein [Clostridia bacterium]|nr:peptidoglycan DD-metalloendopeptidase family protein [Clostridia bacterium]
MDESRKQNPQPNKRRSPLEALLKPIAFLLSIPARKKAKKADKERTKRRHNRRQIAIARASQLYNHFTVKRARQHSVTAKEHNAVFEVNGLGRFDRWYNTTSIRLHEKSEQAGSRYRKEFEHLFEHPAGWCINRREVFKRNFYDLLLDLMELLPRTIHLKNRLTAPFRKAGDFLAHTDSSAFSMRSLAHALPIFCNWIAPIITTIAAVLYISDTMQYDVQLMVSINGEQIGIVESRAAMEDAIDSFESTSSTMLGTNYKFGDEISYKLVSTKQKRYLTGAEIYRELNEVLRDNYTMSWALYADGSYVAAAEDYDALSAIISGLESVEKVESETHDTIGRFDIIRKLCQNDTILTPETIYWRLVGDDEARITAAIEEAANVEALSSVLNGTISGDTEITINNDIGTVTEGSVTAFLYSTAGAVYNTDLDFGVLRGDSSTAIRTEGFTALSGVVTDGTVMMPETSVDTILRTQETLQVEEEIPFTTIYEDTSSYFVGTEKLSTEGVPGTRLVTYTVEYVNGEEYSRIATASEVVTLPISEVILRGTAIKPSTTPTGTFIWPASGSITSAYGGRQLFGSYDFHLGIDISGYVGKPIYAADGGTVIQASTHRSYGKLTIISHGNGIVSYYAHQSEQLVKVGDKVYQGQLIGKMGNTGVTTGPHLHFEIRRNGSTVNPLKYLP